MYMCFISENTEHSGHFGPPFRRLSTLLLITCEYYCTLFRARWPALVRAISHFRCSSGVSLITCQYQCTFYALWDLPFQVSVQRVFDHLWIAMNTFQGIVASFGRAGELPISAVRPACSRLPKTCNEKLSNSVMACFCRYDLSFSCSSSLLLITCGY